MGTRYQFKGYDSKPNKYLGDGSIASDCNNVIFNRGDLCNFPMSIPTQKIISNPFIADDENLCTFYYYTARSGAETKDISALVLFNTKGEIWITHYNIFSTRPNEQFVHRVVLDFGDIIRFRYPFAQADTRQYSAINLDTLSGNLIQVGDWLMFLCQTGDQIPSSPGVGIPKIYPQMFRMRFPGLTQFSQNIEYRYLRSLIGIYQPSNVILSSLLTPGTITGNQIDFGFSFAIKSYDYESPTISPNFEELESNVTILNAPADYSNNAALFKIYLPAGHNTFWPHGVSYLNIYAKLKDQSIYYYVGQKIINGEQIHIDSLNRSYIETIVNVGLAQDLTKPAPLTSLTPIVGAHDPPKLATHGAYYKGKMYYNCLEFSNLLQISARTPAGQIDTGLYANYIEAWEFIGKETAQITGIIEYQGQLIIFQDVETYVLTNDLNAEGEIRILFHDLGCIKGGKAYLTVAEKLFFGSRTGIYVYDGSSEPVRISTSIQKDLEKISRIRYQYMRLSHDPEHKLLMVNFPWGKGCDKLEIVPTFIFHYEDGGKWTKTEAISDILVDKFSTQDSKKQYNILYNSRKSLRLIKSIDDNVEFEGDGQSWMWTSSFFDMNTLERMKHWKWLMLETIPKLSYLFDITVEFFNEENESLDIAQLDPSLDPITEKKFRRISANAKHLWFRLTGTTKRAFRLVSFELEGHVKTRR